jgi:predicted kinase
MTQNSSKNTKIKIALAVSVILNLLILARAYGLWTNVVALNSKLQKCEEKNR